MKCFIAKIPTRWAMWHHLQFQIIFIFFFFWLSKTQVFLTLLHLIHPGMQNNRCGPVQSIKFIGSEVCVSGQAQGAWGPEAWWSLHRCPRVHQHPPPRSWALLVAAHGSGCWSPLGYWCGGPCSIFPSVAHAGRVMLAASVPPSPCTMSNSTVSPSSTLPWYS